MTALPRRSCANWCRRWPAPAPWSPHIGVDRPNRALRILPYGQNRILRAPGIAEHLLGKTELTATEADMTEQQHADAVAAFIRAKGITRCPTACAVPTQARLGDADRRALRQRDDRLEAIREERHHQA